ncbi:hypothetical protein KIW84_021411 [Lathyrus oleraceus]|uniref:Uncharacterized protein n=1 Tax=Pisum sativum TaxID=3888 RepID=A0A9D4Y7S0_PEA|nr:hypothetical protein KIW84_021411 [Pisum sativum]
MLQAIDLLRSLGISLRQAKFQKTNFDCIDERIPAYFQLLYVKRDECLNMISSLSDTVSLPKFFLLLQSLYCLWILGNESTLINSDSVWRNIVLDAKKRDCFHNAEEDKKLAQAVEDALFDLQLLEESESRFKKPKLDGKSILKESES